MRGETLGVRRVLCCMDSVRDSKEGYKLVDGHVCLSYDRSESFLFDGATVHGNGNGAACTGVSVVGVRTTGTVTEKSGMFERLHTLLRRHGWKSCHTEVLGNSYLHNFTRWLVVLLLYVLYRDGIAMSIH